MTSRERWIAQLWEQHPDIDGMTLATIARDAMAFADATRQEGGVTKHRQLSTSAEQASDAPAKDGSGHLEPHMRGQAIGSPAAIMPPVPSLREALDIIGELMAALRQLEKNKGIPDELSVHTWERALMWQSAALASHKEKDERHR